MRAGGCTVQQALTAEAATVVKQAVTLARRRGHAQVTPLHVANTMLSSSTGLLRTACLQSHSHPLQCKALELCFNVALNRLPASTSSPMFGSHSQQYPSISNALVAAFKRAQAHQRRGSIENQQQPLLAVKIELEQLIISILDDPSVSRVMREAGFSSTQVKSNVEQAVSLEIYAQSAPSVSSKSKEIPFKSSKPITSLDTISNEDVKSVIENLMNERKRSIVIVGESLGSIEEVVKGVMNKVIKGDVPEALREVKFIPFPISSLANLSMVEVAQKLEDLKSLVRSYMSKGVVLNLGDLKWISEYMSSSSSSEQGRSSYLCPMEHMIMELGKLVNCGKFWLMGIANFQTYMKCKSGHPSLETVWGLHPLTIPAGSLRLSLITDSDVESRSTSYKADQNGNGSSCLIILEGDEEKQLTCCADCTSRFETEARSFQTSTCNSDSTTSSLPPWLQQYKNNQTKAISNTDDQDSVSIIDLRRKWNSICSSIHHQSYSSRKTITFSSASGCSYDQRYPNLHQTHHNGPTIEPKQSWRDCNFWVCSETVNNSSSTIEPSLRIYIPEHRDQYPKTPFSSNPNSTPNSTSSSDVMEMEYLHKFTELNAENLKTLCNAMEKKVPWQKDIVPEIASTILQCRSGMVRRKGSVRYCEAKAETWLFFQGVDIEAKEKIAKELARLVFGSQNNFISIALSSFSSTRADSTEDFRNKRSREEQSCSYIERFAEALSSNPHRVFLVEDVEQADYCSQMGFKRAIERGRITNSCGEEVGLSDAIIILSCESFSSRSRACSPSSKQKTDNSQDEEKGSRSATMEETSPCVSLDLNISIDDDGAEDQSIDNIGLLESVDRRIIFKIQEL